jgi:ribonuclease III family protein
MILSTETLNVREARAIAVGLLSHLGDAVLHLFERENLILSAATAAELHQQASEKACASRQAVVLDLIAERLTSEEADIVRRSRNLKSPRRKAGQNAYRKAQALEALVGYLYLTNPDRLREVLSWTMSAMSGDS